MMPYVSRMSGRRVSPNSAVAASESCSGIRHKLMSRCERSLVSREENIRGELSGTPPLTGARHRRCHHWANLERYVIKTCGKLFAACTLRFPSWLADSYHAKSYRLNSGRSLF